MRLIWPTDRTINAKPKEIRPFDVHKEVGMMRVGRNDPCPCGSGKKYKHCCLSKDEANDREAARERIKAQAAPTLALPVPPSQPLLPAPPPQLNPEEEAHQRLWEAFESAEASDLPALFRRALAEELLDEDFVYELLATLRENDERDMAEAMIGELRAARPDIYQSSAPYYLEWQIADALASGRRDLLPELAEAMADTAGNELDMFYLARDQLAYHGYLGLITAMMRRAWPLVRHSDKFIPGADIEFAADGQQLTLLAYAERGQPLYADDPDLLAALEFFAPVDRDLLAELLRLLSGEEDRPWAAPDHPEDEQVNRLAFRFQGEIYRAWGVPLSRGELGRIALVNYLMQRHNNDRRSSAKRPRSARRLARIDSAELTANLLCPDHKSLDGYMAQLLSLISSRFYQAAALLELTPAWLRFLQDQELISEQQRRTTLAELRKLVDDAAPIWEQHRSDPLVGRIIQDAWEWAERAAE